MRSTGCALQALTKRDSGAGMNDKCSIFFGKAGRSGRTLVHLPFRRGQASREYPVGEAALAYHFRRLFVEVAMAANQVVLYFDNQEDAVLFTLAASSVISADKTHSSEAVMKVAQKISKASRIKTEGELAAVPAGD